MRLEFCPFVASDLDDIAACIAQDSTRRAVTFIQTLRLKFSDIQSNRLIYQLRPEICDEARLAAVGRYVILFRVEDDVVRIERVAYDGRDLPAILDD